MITYVISLPNSPRRLMASESLGRTMLSWCFFDALTSEQGCGMHYDERRAWEQWGRPLTGSEIGCAASHIAVMRRIVDDNSEWALVLEDDLYIDPSFDFLGLPGLCSKLGLLYLRLYARSMAGPKHVGWVDQREILRFRRSPMGTQAYMISRSGAVGFLNSIDKISRPIDWEMDRYWHNGLANYAVFPFPVIEVCSASSVAKFGEHPRGRTAAQSVSRFLFRAREYSRRAIANRRLCVHDRTLRALLSTTSVWSTR
jgi:GR25 family glycosyltransferase involved in LPS biosynthesis